MIIGTNFEVLSEKPLWTYDEENKPVLIKNTYDNIEVIRYYPMGKENYHYYDIPIEDPITVFMPFGIFFFKTKEFCEMFSKQIDTPEGKQTVLENSFESSRHNKNIVKLTCRHEIPNGIYSLKELDDILIADDLFNLRFIDENNNVREILQANNTINEYIREYMKMFIFTERHNLQYERVLFELYSENDKLYINHIFINCGSYYTFNRILLNSRIMNYPICETPISANYVKICLDSNAYNGIHMQSEQDSMTSLKEAQERKERNKELVKKIAKMCGEFAWEHKQEIFMGIKALAGMIA